MYASRTGTKKNLAALRQHGWRLLVSATGAWRNEGFPYALDNGAWTYAQKGLPFDGGRFMELVSFMGHGSDWIVLPDVVGDSDATARMTDEWLPRLAGYKTLAVIQDGAEESHMDRLFGLVHGFFLGGSDEYKLASIDRWGAFAKERGAYYHVGRVNSEKRIRLCEQAGADSVDGTSATRFCKNTPRLTRASREVSLFGWARRGAVVP